MDREALKELIRQAFANVERPGNWALRGGNEGDEPFLVEQEFSDKSDWRALDPAFLEQAPSGYSSALSFFSDEAFRYFLPAYLIADLDGALDRADPLFHLTHGLSDAVRNTKLNERRFGDRTWFDARQHQFSVFSAWEAKAIVEYLRYKLDVVEFNREEITGALSNYWLARAGLA
ncbi:MAG TPA: DUF6714 family protein [Gemmatimonadaceae bacterium]|nr:DUF6714 family protein [Gemmatimonadaceae bacterium]